MSTASGRFSVGLATLLVLMIATCTFSIMPVGAKEGRSLALVRLSPAQGAVLSAGLLRLHGQPITTNPTAYTYSRVFNVSEAEAEYRSMKSISAAALEARIQASEPDTFGGLYIEHQPDFKIVVLFTKKPAETLAKYTQDPVFTGRVSARSLETLLATQAEAEAQLLAKRVEFESGLDIRRSIVTFYVKDEAAARRALRPLLGAVDFMVIKQVKGFAVTTAISV